MRLHHLTVTAFGPFAGTERVDFDALGEAGVFLVTGATGAGKSSLLDAVCFALYGVVPGARGVRALRSDHAAPDAVPEVALDFSVHDRRFVVRRSPEWTRPRRGGEGLTTIRARASLLETTDGAQRLVSSRAQEVGHAVSDLLQVSSTQFQQVVLLPQGGFATFLRATSQERHDVLQQLFHTRRFADIESWVHDHSRDLRARAAEAAGDVRRLAHTLSDRSGRPLPDAMERDALVTASPDQLRAWAERLTADAATAAAEAEARRTASRRAVDEAGARHRQAVRASELRGRHRAATAELAQLAETETEASAARAAVESDTHAAHLAPVLRLLVEAERAVAETRGQRDPVAVLVTRHAERRDQLTRLRALLPREEELADAERDCLALRTRLTERETEEARLLAEAATTPERLRALVAHRETLAREAAHLGRVEVELAAAAVVHRAAAALPQARAAASDARAAAVDARARAVGAQETLLRLVERRLAGIAAELAETLADHERCPVCGSLEHPHPAEPVVDRVDARDQQAAQQDWHRLQAAAVRAEEEAANREAERERLAQTANGHDEPSARATLARLESAREAARVAERARDATTQEVERLEAALDDQRRALHRARTERVAAERDLAAAEGLRDRLRRELAAAVAAVPGVGIDAGSPPARLAEIVDVVRRDTDRLDREVQAARAAQRAEEDHDRARAQAEQAAREHGFGSVTAARAGVLPTAERERLTRLLRDRDSRRHRAEAVLADLDLEAVGDGLDRPADTAATGAALAAAEAEAEEAGRAAHLSEATSAATARLLGELHDALARWEPARDRAATADAMAGLVRGTGADNQLQMRLSAYVLATRLDQVVDAANERLGHLREHRYLLERTGRAARKGSPAGLGLQVLDLWTGEVRDPGTLSGGETFVVSLALALGLADVVTQEAGGVELQALFVDEGFGMLDAETLDDVMDRLDGLRAGGRTVGVVSHVAELRSRIPVQLHVEKGRAGSRVAVRNLIA